MTITHVIGVDPGLVHTGMVSIRINQIDRSVKIEHAVLDTCIPDEVYAQVLTWTQVPTRVFVEDYVPRPGMSTNTKMVGAMVGLKQHKGMRLLDAKYINNTGVLKVVKTAVLHSLDLHAFSTTTHHQDLRSAARIAIFGMYKEPGLNSLLATIVRADLDGDPWEIAHV